MSVQTAAKSAIHISDATTTASSQSDFETETYTKIGSVEDIGEFGSEFSTSNFTAIDDRIVQKFKGTEDPGTIQLQLGLDPDDAGQTQLQTALADDNEYAIKVTLNDAGTGSPSSPTTYYFRGRVMGLRRQINSAENVVRGTVTIGINTRPIEVAAV